MKITSKQLLNVFATLAPRTIAAGLAFILVVGSARAVVQDPGQSPPSAPASATTTGPFKVSHTWHLSRARTLALSRDEGDSLPTPHGQRKLLRLQKARVLNREQASVAGLLADPRAGAGGPASTLVAQVGPWMVWAQKPATKFSPRAISLPPTAKLTPTVPLSTDAKAVFVDPETGLVLLPTDSLIVRLQPTADPLSVLGNQDRTWRPLAGTTDQFVVTYPNADADHIFGAVRQLATDPRVLWAEPNFIAQSLSQGLSFPSPLAQAQWHLQNTGQSGATPGADINAVNAWTVTHDNSNIVLCPMDDSPDITHPDLLGNLFTNPGEIPGNGLDDDGNGYPDDIHGYNFSDGTGAQGAPDPHATAVLGLLVANGFDHGVLGVAPGCQAMPVVVYQSTLAAKAEAMYYAGGRTKDGHGRWRGADVITLSITFPQSQAFDDATAWVRQHGRNEKGCLIFAAAGNQAADWQKYVIDNIPAGTHTFEWRYVKDPSGSAGQDCVWLDGIQFPDGSHESFQGSALPTGWTLTVVRLLDLTAGLLN